MRGKTGQTIPPEQGINIVIGISNLLAHLNTNKVLHTSSSVPDLPRARAISFQPKFGLPSPTPAPLLRTTEPMMYVTSSRGGFGETSTLGPLMSFPDQIMDRMTASRTNSRLDFFIFNPPDPGFLDLICLSFRWEFSHFSKTTGQLTNCNACFDRVCLPIGHCIELLRDDVPHWGSKYEQWPAYPQFTWQDWCYSYDPPIARKQIIHHHFCGCRLHNVLASVSIHRPNSPSIPNYSDLDLYNQSIAAMKFR
jgi:hypothetical protein